MSQDLLTQKVAKVHEISLQRSPLLFHINMEPEKGQLEKETQNKQITIFLGFHVSFEGVVLSAFPNIFLWL